MKSVIIITIAFVLLVPTMVYAVEGYWINQYGKQISNVPTVCFFQPNDSRVDEQLWNNWFSDMKIALYTWESVLEQSGNGYWEITIVDVPLHKLELLNYSTCDITVNFIDEPDPVHPTWLGWYTAGTGKISIVYSDYGYCGKEYLPKTLIMVNTYCFGENIENSKRMASVLQHEFGHALGMGHYISDNYNLTQKWYDGFDTPSIMAFQHPNEELKNITQIDVNLVREIYGEKGFGKKIGSTTIFNEPYVPEPIVEVSDVISIKVNENSEVIKMISGHVPDKLYKKGIIVEVVIQKPDGFIEYKGISIDKTLNFYNFPLTFDYSSQIGNHEITLKFNDEIFKKTIINVSKEQMEIQKNVELIHKNIQEIEKIEEEITSVDNVKNIGETPKFCFLFWCW